MIRRDEEEDAGSTLAARLPGPNEGVHLNLRSVLHDFVEHYHVERNHQGLGNVIPFPSRASPQFEGTVCRRQRLGGMLNFYERKAA